MRNKSGIRSFSVALCTLLLWTSCSSDNDFMMNVTPDCSLTNMVLGALKRQIKTTTPTGKDTTIYSAYNAELYRMSIDELNREIYNTDSLPMGTDIRKVTFSSITADGTIYYRDLKTDRDTLFIQTDSMDFSQPRLFTIVSSDQTARRTYTVRLNVRNSESQAFTWQRKGTDAQLAGMQLSRAFIINNRLTVMGREADGQTFCLYRNTNEEGDFERSRTVLLDGCDPAGIRQMGDTLYVLTGETVYRSTDGCEWTATESDFTPARLLGNGSNELYALGTDGQLYRSTDARTWTAETADTDLRLIPEGTTATAYMPLITNPKLESVLMAGFTNDEARIWRKIVDRTNTEQYAWSYYPQTEENKAPLPQMTNISMMAYDTRILFWGMDEGRTKTLCSGDGGRSWLEDNVYTLPAGMATPESMACTIENELYIWVVCGGTGEIWRGYLNRLHINP